MQADCRNLFINHHGFKYDGVYDEDTDSSQAIYILYIYYYVH